MEWVVDRESLAPYGVVELFDSYGWPGVLDIETDRIFKDEIEAWMKTLKESGKENDKNGWELSGKVGNRWYTLTTEKIARLLNVDTGAYSDEREPIEQYTCLNRAALKDVKTNGSFKPKYADLFIKPEQGARYFGETLSNRIDSSL